MRRLPAKDAAIGSRPDYRGQRLRSQRDREQSGADCRRRTTGRTARSTSRIKRVASRPGAPGGELGGHGLADDHRAGLLERNHTSGVASRLEAGINRAAHLRRHVARFNDVLDTHGHAVQRRERRAGAITQDRLVGGTSCAFGIKMGEGVQLRLNSRNLPETALEVVARIIAAGDKGLAMAHEGCTLRMRRGIGQGQHVGGGFHGVGNYAAGRKTESPRQRQAGLGSPSWRVGGPLNST